MHHQPHLFSKIFEHEKQRIVDGAASARSIAFIVPSTRLTINEAIRLQNRDGLLIVGSESTAQAVSPAQALAHVRAKETTPPVVVFTDQIVDIPASTVLVRTDHGERYFSPIEAILNTNYGFKLAVWRHDGFRFIESNSGLDAVMAMLVAHLDDAITLGEAWEASRMQLFRQPVVRKFNARRRLRIFRSAVINAFRDNPRSPSAASLLAKVDALEGRMLAPQ